MAWAQSGYKNVGPQQFERLRKQDSVVLLDVRTQREVAQGAIPGARKLDYYGHRFEEKLAELKKGPTYLVYCSVGGRSARASQKLAEKGHENVYNLKGGFRAWEEAGLPTTP